MSSQSNTKDIEIIKPGLVFERCSIHKRLTQHFNGTCVHCRVLETKNSIKSLETKKTEKEIPENKPVLVWKPANKKLEKKLLANCLECKKPIRKDRKRCLECSIKKKKTAPIESILKGREKQLQALMRYHKEKLYYLERKLLEKP